MASSQPPSSLDTLSILTLGTAQLGLDYGIANTQGLLDEAGAHAILQAACDAGIACLDTSRDYGSSEDRIGRWLAGAPRRPAVVTKTAKMPADAETGAWIASQVAASLAALAAERVDAVLVRSDDFLRPGTVEALRRLRAQGRIGAFGISVYEAAHLEAALEVEDLRAVQLPMNILDTRFHQTGLLARCAARGVRVFVRSAYLQGLLLMAPERVPEPLAAARPLLAELHALAGAEGLSMQQAAFAFVRDIPGVSSVVVGAETPRQLAGSLEAAAAPALSAPLRAALAAVAAQAPDWLVDPRRWPKP